MHSPDEGGVDTGTGQRGTFLRFVVEAGILDVLPRYPFLLSSFLFSLERRVCDGQTVVCAAWW